MFKGRGALFVKYRLPNKHSFLGSTIQKDWEALKIGLLSTVLYKRIICLLMSNHNL